MYYSSIKDIVVMTYSSNRTIMNGLYSSNTDKNQKYKSLKVSILWELRQ